MPTNSKPPRYTQDVVAVMYYFSIHGVNKQAVSELIKLKVRRTDISPKQFLERIRFAEKVDFPERGLQWTPTGVGEEIANIVERDRFVDIATIDGACEEVLSKASLDARDSPITCVDHGSQYPDIPMAVLKDENNEVRAAAMKIFDFRAQVAESRAARFPKYSELPQNNPPQPSPWKEDAIDPFLGSETLLPSPRPFGL